jgi:pyrroloquinoline quinone biosynthesis protein E
VNARHPPIPLPTNLVLEVTSRCNHDCLHCYNAWKNQRPYPLAAELDTAALVALIRKVQGELGLEQLTLTGGEPLLRPDLPELVLAFRELGLGLNLITNGTLLDEAALDRLTPDRIDVFELPLLADEPALHDRLSGAVGAHERVLEAIAELKLRDQLVVAVFVATELNRTRFRATAELAFALGADGLMLNRFNPGGRGAEHLELLQSDPAALQTLLDEAEALSERYDFQIACSIAMPPCLIDTGRYRRLSFGFCAAGTERAYYTVDPSGNLRPCNHSPTILGNLQEASVAELLAGETLRGFLEARPARCAGCRLERSCQGGCKAAAEACFGSASLADPFLERHWPLARPPR